MQTCSKCKKELVVKDAMFFWRGHYFTGLVCEECKALYDNPDDSFLAHVKKTAEAEVVEDAIFALVADRPVKFSVRNNCPYCTSTDVQMISRYSTVNYPDPHFSDNCVCTACERSFCRERKGANIWFTSKGKVLLGMPSCFESYTYTCRHCGGDVQREYRELDGVTLLVGNALRSAEGKPQFRPFYKCSKCNREIEYPENYWSPKREHGQTTVN